MVISQKKKVRMVEAVIWLFNNKQTVLLNNPKVPELIELIKNELATVYDVEKKLTTVQKKEVAIPATSIPTRTSMVKSAIIIAQKIAAHATYIRLPWLFRETNINEKDLTSLTDYNLCEAVAKIITRSEEYFNELRDYHLTAEMLDDLRKQHEAFSNKVPAPPKEKPVPVEHISTRTTLYHITQIEELLMRLDVYLKEIELQDIAFYQEYRIFRFGSIDEADSIHLRVGAFDAETGQRISGAFVEVYRNPEMRNECFSRFTRPKRNLLFKGVYEGVWHISVSDNHYQSDTVTVELHDPKQAVVNVLMHRK